MPEFNTIGRLAAAVFDEDTAILSSSTANPGVAHGAVQTFPAVLYLVEYTPEDAVAVLTVQDHGTSEAVIPLLVGGDEVLSAIGRGLRRQSMRRKIHEKILARTTPVGGVGRAPSSRSSD